MASSFKSFLSEKKAEIHVKKGAFHAWLGKSPDEPITAADIAKGKAAGGHAEKMAIFAQNFGHHKESVDAYPSTRVWRLSYKGSKTGKDSHVHVKAHTHEDALKRGKEITPHLEPHSVVLVKEDSSNYKPTEKVSVPAGSKKTLRSMSMKMAQKKGVDPYNSHDTQAKSYKTIYALHGGKKIKEDIESIEEIQTPLSGVNKPKTQSKDYKEWERKSSEGAAKVKADVEKRGVYPNKKIKEDADLDESKLAMPLKGHHYHEKPDSHLHYIVKDASEAAMAMRGHNPHAESKYLDQMNDAATVLHYRSKGGKQVTPVKEEVLDEESPVTGTRIISKHGVVGSKHHAEVRYHKDYEEYSVHHYKHGKHMGEGPVSYHGNDKEDAKNTAEHEVKRHAAMAESVEVNERITNSKQQLQAAIKAAELKAAETAATKKQLSYIEMLKQAYRRLTGKKKVYGKDIGVRTEEIEINELSKDTLKSYKSKALERLKKGKGKISGKEEKHFNGVAKAVHRIKEETLDEISKDKLKRYVTKATVDLQNRGREEGMKIASGERSHSEFTKGLKRVVGITKAAHRLARK